MRVDLFGLTMETPGTTFYLWSPWRCSALEHKLFESLRTIPNASLEAAADEIRIHITDANGWFTIVLSRPQDRPANATAANGVTWRDWGPQSNVGMMIRYMAVGPEWTFAKAPTELNLGRGSDWASTQFNENLIGKNNRTGWMGEYLPVVGYMTPTAFQALGNGWINPQTVPVWK